MRPFAPRPMGGELTDEKILNQERGLDLCHLLSSETLRPHRYLVYGVEEVVEPRHNVVDVDAHELHVGKGRVCEEGTLRRLDHGRLDDLGPEVEEQVTWERLAAGSFFLDA